MHSPKEAYLKEGSRLYSPNWSLHFLNVELVQTNWPYQGSKEISVKHLKTTSNTAKQRLGEPLREFRRSVFTGKKDYLLEGQKVVHRFETLEISHP